MLLLSLAFATGASARIDGAPSEEPSIFSKCWEYKIDTNSSVGVTADSTAAYLLDIENKLNGIDLSSGNKLWTSELGGEAVSDLLIVGDAVVLATNSQLEREKSAGKTVVRSISRQTGITAWSAEVSSSPSVWLGASNGQLFIVGSNGVITSLNLVDGKTAWSFHLDSEVSAEPNFTQRGIELGTKNKDVIRISPTGGRQTIWKSKFLPTALVTDTTGRLLVGDDRGNLTSISVDGDRSWVFRNGAQISATSQYDSEYLATSHDNFVYKLSRDGDVKWKRRLSGRITDGPVILGDTAVFSTVGTGSVYVLDLRNGKISNRIETGEEESLRIASAGTEQRSFVVAGPRGLLYFSAKCPAK